MLVAACGGSGTAPSIVTSTLPGAVAGETYSAEITGAGGTEPFSWTLVGGAPAGLELAAAGRTAALRGVVDTAGDFEILVQLADADGLAAERTLDLEVVAPLRITTTELPAGAPAVPYSAIIEATGGTGRERVWTVVDGTLPDGLVLDRGGFPSTTISGTAAAGTDGVHRFAIAVEDSGFVRATQSFELELADGGLRFITTELQPARLFNPYDESIEIAGGTAPYTWRTVAGTPPPGVVFRGSAETTAHLTGEPTRAGRFSFEIEVEDDAGATTGKVFNLDVRRTVVISTGELPLSIRGEAYAATIETMSGTEIDYVWTVAGTLPPGLTLEAMSVPNGLLSGTPEQSGQYDFTVTVTDGAGGSDDQEFTLDVVEPLEIVGANAGSIVLPNGRGTESYLATLTATGGVGLYSWSVSQGRFADGITLATEGTPSAAITGRPVQLGTFVATITVRDEAGLEASADVEMTVELPSTLPTIVTSTIPSGVVCDGYHQPITATGGSTFGYTWSVVSGSLPPGFNLSPTGDPTTSIDGGFSEQTGTYTFTVEVTDLFGRTDDATFTIAVADELGGFRWVAAANDLTARNEHRIHLVDVCGAQSPAVDVTPANPPMGGNVLYDETSAGFSPDGRAFAYVGDLTVDERFDVYLVPLTTGVPGSPIRLTGGLPFTSSRGAIDLRWSPDGSLLAFRADPTTDGAHELFVVDVTNPSFPGPPVRVSPEFADAASGVVEFKYHFAPDNSQIAYIGKHAGQDRPWVVDIAAIPAGGAAGLPREVHPSGGIGRVRSTLIWTHDSRALIYSGGLADPLIQEPWWVDVSGVVPGTPVPLGRPSGVLPPSSCFFSTIDHSSNLALSPDGTKIVVGCPEGVQYRELPFVIDLTGSVPGTPVRLLDVATPSFTGAYFTWSPDSTKLALISDHRVAWQAEGYVVDMTGSFPAIPTRLDHPGYGPITMMTGAEIHTFNWSPDGRWLAAQGDLEVDDQTGAYVTNISAGPPYALQRVHPNFPSTASETRSMQFSWDSRFLAVYTAWELAHPSRNSMHVVDLGAPPGTWSLAHDSTRALSFNYQGGWLAFWYYFWTPANDLLFMAGERFGNDEVQSVDVGGTPPYASTIIGPAFPVAGSDVDKLWGQGVYAKREVDRWRLPTF